MGLGVFRTVDVIRDLALLGSIRTCQLEAQELFVSISAALRHDTPVAVSLGFNAEERAVYRKMLMKVSGIAKQGKELVDSDYTPEGREVKFRFQRIIGACDHALALLEESEVKA